MIITNVSAEVRIVNYGDPFTFPHDIVVERLSAGQWISHWSTNSLSNDFAYIEARRAARALAAALLSA